MTTERNPSSLLDEMQGAIEGASQRLGPVVVGIESRRRRATGVVLEAGLVVTSAYLAGSEELAVYFGQAKRPGRVKGIDPASGLCVVAAETGDIAPPQWSDDPAANVGDAVIALANPGGRGLRATLGFIAATDRSFRGPRGRRITGGFEHTAALVPGSAGGPLCDPAGRLFAVNAVRLEGGVSLAVLASESMRARISERARADQPAQAPRLGIAVAGPRTARRMRRAVGLTDRGGILVRAVEPESPAARAELSAGDLIVRANDRPLEHVDDLHQILDEQAQSSRPMGLTVVRGETERSAQVSFVSTES